MGQVDSLRTEDKFKKTEIGEIPVDWEILTLDDISEEIYRYPTYYNIKYLKQGIPEVRGELIKSNGTLATDLSKYRFISPETASEFPRTRLKQGDFVLSVRGTMGKIAIIPKFLDGANMTANLIRISPDRERIFPSFFHQVLISEKFQKTLNIASSSTTIKTIKAPELKRLKFAIPPFPEQKKITEILLTVDNTLEKKKEIIEKTKELKKGLMQELLARGIGHKKFKKTVLGEIPAEWELVKLSEVISSYKNGIWGDDPTPDEKSYPVIRSTEITHDGEIDLSDVAFRKVSEEQAIKYKLQDSDILLVASSGSPHLVGRSALFEQINSEKLYLFSNFMIRIRPNNINSCFLFYFLNSSYYHDFLRYLQQTSTGLRNLPRKEFIKMALPYPPFSEQKKIAEILSSVDEEIEKEIVNKERLEDIKKGLMQVLLTGKVRVRT